MTMNYTILSPKCTLRTLVDTTWNILGSDVYTASNMEGDEENIEHKGHVTHIQRQLEKSC